MPPLLHFFPDCIVGNLDHSITLGKCIVDGDMTVRQIIDMIISTTADDIFFSSYMEAISLIQDAKKLFIHKGRTTFVLYKENTSLKFLHVYYWAKAGKKFRTYVKDVDLDHIWSADIGIVVLFQKMKNVELY